MKNKFTVAIFFVLLILAGLGWILKEAMTPSLSTQEKLNTGSENLTSKQKNKNERLKLFKPLVSDRKTPIVNSVTTVKQAAANSDAEKEKIPDYLANTPAAVLKKRLLQGNQNKQRATKFLKVGFGGETLSDASFHWSCARDIKTGLLWETKLNDAGVSDVEHRYSWYDPSRSTRGHKNEGYCYAINCDTHAYVQEINRLGLCGSQNWRLPAFAELESILDRNYFYPVINQEIFFNTRGASYWTQTQLDNNPEMIMQIDFFNGSSSPAPIHFKLAVRLVSD